MVKTTLQFGELISEVLGTLNRVSDSYLEIAKKLAEEGLNRYGWEAKTDDNFDALVSRNIVLQLVAKYSWQNKREIAIELFKKQFCNATKL